MNGAFGNKTDLAFVKDLIDKYEMSEKQLIDETSGRINRDIASLHEECKFLREETTRRFRELSPSRLLDEREEKLVDQIYRNMANRNIISGEELEEGIEKSELRILAYHMKRITMEKVAHDIMQKALEM